jgi:hypothetical protein
MVNEEEGNESLHSGPDRCGGRIGRRGMDSGMTIVSPKVLEALTALEPEGDTDTKIAKVVEEALVRRLNHYQFVDRRLQRKYGMAFTQFRDSQTVQQKGYAFDVESDFWEWELAQDGSAPCNAT